MGGALGWAILLVLFGSIGGAFGFLFLGLIIALPISAKAGLASNPMSLKPANYPVSGGFLGASLRFQDRAGDFVLTPAWNLIRGLTDSRMS